MGDAKREVRLLHTGGGEKLVIEAQVLLDKKHVAILWPTAGLVWFNFVTGLGLGAPRGPWRLSDDDRRHYCQLAGLRPKGRALKPPKRKVKKQDATDARQLWLVELDK
jgi:hypothetical protein